MQMDRDRLSIIVREDQLLGYAFVITVRVPIVFLIHLVLSRTVEKEEQRATSNVTFT
jgi:hypothetical protein